MSRLERKRNLLGVGMLTLITFLLCFLIWQNIQAGAEKDAAQSSAVNQAQQKKSLAEEFVDACDTGQVLKDKAGVDLCDRAAAVADEPVTMTGPQGPIGPRGLTGSVGAPGETGATGKTGATGTTGSAGQTGSVGASGSSGASGARGDTGAAGAAGTTGQTGSAGPAGKDGSTGAAGKDGRGILDVECVGQNESSYWLITYSDGTTEQSSGPCRLSASSPQPTTTIP